jgi:hypothetical protein
MARTKKSATKKPHKKSVNSPPTPFPNTGNERVPPGATKAAADRPRNPGGGAPGSGAGPRHAAGDPGSPNESYEASESNEPLADEAPPDLDSLEEGPPYAGPSGGAVGGTPAQGRSSGGTTHRGISPGSTHRGDSTIGTDPDSGAE